MQKKENRLYNAITILLKDCPYLIERIFRSNQCELVASPKEIKGNMQLLSSGEKVLVKTALDFWNGSGNVSFFEILNRLSPNNICNLQNAISLLKNQG